MNIPSAKREGGLIFSVHSTVIVIGNSDSAQVAVKALAAHPVVWVEESARVVEVLGQRGNFRVKVEQKEIEKYEWIEAGTIVLALAPTARLDPALPQSPLIKPLAKGGQTVKTLPNGQNLAFYLNDRDNEHTFELAMHQALTLAANGAVVNFFYFNLKIGNSEQEEMYQQCCRSGVRFLRLTKPLDIIPMAECLGLRYLDPFLGLELDLNVEFLYTAEIHSVSSEFVRLAAMLRIHSGTISTNRPGIFVLSGTLELGLPVEVAAAAVAGEVAPLLGGKLTVAEGFAQIDPKRCSFCDNCYRVCPTGAVEIDHFHSSATINPLVCQSCGVCASACPTLAISLPLFEGSLIKERLRKNSKHKIVVFACLNSGASATKNLSLPSSISAKTELITVPCARAIDHDYLLEALLHGAEQVILATCPPGSCASHSEHKTSNIKRTMQEMGINPALVKIIAVAANSSALWRHELVQVLRAEMNQEVSLMETRV